MQSTKQSLTKSAETAKHEKKIERKSKTEQLVQVFKQKSLLIKQKIIKFLNGDFQSKPPKEM